MCLTGGGITDFLRTRCCWLLLICRLLKCVVRTCLEHEPFVVFEPMITRSRTRVRAAPAAAKSSHVLKLCADADTNNQECSKPSEIEAADCAEVLLDKDTENFSNCLTPKGKRFRIPEIETCPPAPKKSRKMDTSSCKLKRSPIAFFSPPELELLLFLGIPTSQ